MDIALEPLAVPSLKEACIRRLEGLILSGTLKIGERLPSERALAEQLGVSRPVVHQALVDLAAKGLVEILPRKGVVVNDFRTQGSCALLSSLLAFSEGELDAGIVRSLVEMRLLMEVEAARLAALHRTAAQAQQLQEIFAAGATANPHDARSMAELDFAFHQLITLASGNVMYPLIINSFKGLYTHLTRRFFEKHAGAGVLAEMLELQRALVAAIASNDEEAAASAMKALLVHGAEHM